MSNVYEKNVNTAEINEADAENVSGGWLGDPEGWFVPQGRGKAAKHYKFADFGVEVEKKWIGSSIYRINGREVTLEQAYEYARKKQAGEI